MPPFAGRVIKSDNLLSSKVNKYNTFIHFIFQQITASLAHSLTSKETIGPVCESQSPFFQEKEMRSHATEGPDVKSAAQSWNWN
jgi:hypothetical protein